MALDKSGELLESGVYDGKSLIKKAIIVIIPTLQTRIQALFVKVV